jgi:hypothetical protein
MPGPVPQNNAVGYGPGYYPGYPGVTPGATSMNTFLAPGSR